MLLQFTVENYLSFDEEATFSLLATGDKDHPRHVIAGNPPTLRGAAIYGANASGKSNLIAAMEFSRRLILRGVRPGQSIGVRPFAVGNSEKKPSRFEWIFRHGGRVWSYLIEAEPARVVAESLYMRDENGTRDALIFERTAGETGGVEFGAKFRGPQRGKRAQFLDFVAKGCRPEQPFLSEAKERNVEGLDTVQDWFETVLHIVPTGSLLKNLGGLLTYRAEILDFLSDFLKFADVGIECLVLERQPLCLEELPSWIEEEDFNRMSADFEAQPEGVAVFQPGGVFAAPRMVQRDESGAMWLIVPKARHRNVNGEARDFPFEWESAGTRRLLHLGPWLFRLRSMPTVLIIDELDQHLHTLLTREFVRLAFDAKREAAGQLILTTHDTNLLDKDLLRRDEIYFVTKGKGGASRLRSLAEYKVRGDLVYEKGYLLGRFDAIPTFWGIERLLRDGESSNGSKAEDSPATATETANAEVTA